MDNRGMIKWGLVLSAAILLAGCSSTKHGKMGKTSSSTENTMAVTSGAGQNESFWGDELATMNDNELLDRQTFYFAYDSSDVNDNYKRSLQAHARYLKNNPGAKMRLEGHTDERGSTEYNIALGERRAQTIERIMAAEGAQTEQIDIVSYGRQKPAVNGHDEDAWKFNRRAVVVYEAS